MEIIEAFYIILHLGGIFTITVTVIIATLSVTSVVVVSIIVLGVIIGRKSSCCSTKEEAVYDDVKTPSQKDLTLTQNVAYGYVPRRSTTAAT